MLLNKDEINNNKSNKWAYKGDDPWVIFSLPAIYSINKFGFRDGRILETGSDVYNLRNIKYMLVLPEQQRLIGQKLFMRLMLVIWIQK